MVSSRKYVVTPLYFPSIGDMNHMESISSFFEKWIPKSTTVVVGVSGWPDSMFLFFCVHSWYTQNKRDTKKIIIAHYNHKQRKESTNEQAFLQKYFSDYTFYYNTDKPNQGSSETELRTMRHIFFNEVCEKEKASFLLLGHNLTDRVETSILSMVRGAGIDGVLGIKATQDKKKYIILRPLISLEKQYITKQCIELRIPYFVDTTNSQPITSRNILRNDIVPSIQSLHIGWVKNWYKSWNALYNTIEANQQTTGRKEHVPHHLWWAGRWCSSPIQTTNSFVRKTLFKDRYYFTGKTQKAIESFLLSKSEWHLYIGWWYIFKVGADVHCVDWPKDFWKKKHDINKPIKHSWLLQFDREIYTVKKEYIGAVIRYPQPWDIFAGKRLLKTLLNKKIPVFARNTIPVVADGKKILTILL